MDTRSISRGRMPKEAWHHRRPATEVGGMRGADSLEPIGTRTAPLVSLKLPGTFGKHAPSTPMRSSYAVHLLPANGIG